MTEIQKDRKNSKEFILKYRTVSALNKIKSTQ